MGFNIKDFIIFAALLYVAGFISPYISQYIPSLAQYGAVGQAVTFALLSLPIYLLLTWFWRRRSK